MPSKIQKAIQIFKSEMPEAKGKFNAHSSESNSNEIDIFSESGLYCTINVQSGRVKNI